MFGSDKFDRLSARIEILNNCMRTWQDNLEELRKKVNGLYEKDIHDTERPKVDILSDYTEDGIHELRDRIIDLEKEK